jgi:hypothetical protein
MAEGTTVLPTNNDPDTGGSPKRDGFVLGRRASLVVSAGVAATRFGQASPRPSRIASMPSSGISPTRRRQGFSLCFR